MKIKSKVRAGVITTNHTTTRLIIRKRLVRKQK